MNLDLRQYSYAAWRGRLFLVVFCVLSVDSHEKKQKTTVITDIDTSSSSAWLTSKVRSLRRFGAATGNLLGLDVDRTP